MHENALRERSAGLDLLRSLCMLMVVILHLLGRGGVMAAAVPFTPNYHLTLLCPAHRLSFRPLPVPPGTPAAAVAAGVLLLRRHHGALCPVL